MNSDSTRYMMESQRQRQEARLWQDRYERVSKDLEEAKAELSKLRDAQHPQPQAQAVAAMNRDFVTLADKVDQSIATLHHDLSTLADRVTRLEQDQTTTAGTQPFTVGDVVWNDWGRVIVRRCYWDRELVEWRVEAEEPGDQVDRVDMPAWQFRHRDKSDPQFYPGYWVEPLVGVNRTPRQVESCGTGQVTLRLWEVTPNQNVDQWTLWKPQTGENVLWGEEEYEVIGWEDQLVILGRFGVEQHRVSAVDLEPRQ